MQNNKPTLHIDVRDATLEQHVSNGEITTIPPTGGESVSSLMSTCRDSDPQHKLVFGSTRAGMSAAYRSLGSDEKRSSRKPASRLLAKLLSRQ
ncbi:hypothetical protein [Burkholderia contaminans]|uniref:hypothetical protein n=1 Tax=Burkholderia contaminans TaxID=488447 RepID=UPI002D7FD998|nr:hypothetical protein [Burkholderia contaminans]